MKKIFLLGGYDLEMLTIKALLEKHGMPYKDKQLSWGAKLSNYSDAFDFEGIIYGIELQEDIVPPQNYIAIDHHGDNAHMPSALEQVATILGIALNREQMLIAANDSRYIDGMKALCASKEEMASIRKQDRSAQGIQESDEILARNTFMACQRLHTNIIYTPTPHFSALSDLVHEKLNRYVIYNFSKILIYGYEIKEVISFLNAKNLAGHFYFGGGAFGFVGIQEGYLSYTKIYNLLKEFQKMQESQRQTHSYHTFMLPFTFKKSFEPKKEWIYEPFSIDTPKEYNEFVYFYKHVQDALFNMPKQTQNVISKYYRYETQNGTYTIESCKGNYTLELDGISLRVFNTNVAILAFNLKNTSHSQPEEILAINDFGRRIYPQFLGLHDYTESTKKAVLAQKITLKLDNHEPIIEDFSRFDTLPTNPNELNLLAKFITFFIGNSIRPIIDDRMFVISQYNNDTMAARLQDKTECGGYVYEDDAFWYRYLFIDGDNKTCQSEPMSKKLIAASTYERWVEWGTLFGISRYSFVALTGSDYGKNILLPHMQTIYFQMFTLLLAYRATIIQFSDEIQDATTNDREITEKSKEVYKKYLGFLNKLYFKEITAQDQGIELYNQAMQVMDIDKYMKDLDQEINELHSYVGLLEEEKRERENEKINKKLEKIQEWGGVLLGASVLTGFFGMNVGSSTNFSPWIAYPLIIGATWWGYKKIKAFNNEGENK